MIIEAGYLTGPPASEGEAQAEPLLGREGWATSRMMRGDKRVQRSPLARGGGLKFHLLMRRLWGRTPMANSIFTKKGKSPSDHP